MAFCSNSARSDTKSEIFKIGMNKNIDTAKLQFRLTLLANKNGDLE